MSKGLSIFFVIVFAVAAFVDFLILKPVSLSPATTQTFTMSDLRETYVQGEVDSINVTSSGHNYYRLQSGETFVEGSFVTGQFFQKNGILAPGHWAIVAGNDISVEIKAASPVSVHTVSNVSNYIVVILVTLLAITLLLLLVATIFF